MVTAKNIRRYEYLTVQIEKPRQLYNQYAVVTYVPTMKPGLPVSTVVLEEKCFKSFSSALKYRDSVLNKIHKVRLKCQNN